MSAVPRAWNEIIVFRRQATLESGKARMVFFARLRGQIEWEDNLLKILKEDVQLGATFCKTILIRKQRR